MRNSTVMIMNDPNAEQNVLQTSHRGSGKRVQMAAGALEIMNSGINKTSYRIVVILYFREKID